MVPVEPISFSVGVAALFTSVVECFKYFKAGQAQRSDYELLELEFDLIKSRMLIWGNAIGIGNVVEDGAMTEREAAQPPTLLDRSLQTIKNLLGDHKTLRNKYGLKELPETVASPAATRNLPSFQPLNLFRTSRLYVRLRGHKSIGSRTAWAIFDKEKFQDLISHLKELVDGLERIHPIPVAARDQTFQSSVTTIALSKLRIVDTACEIVYPELEWASIARTVIDASEAGTIDLRNVAEWRSDTSLAPPISNPSLEFKDPFRLLTVQVSLVLTAPCMLVSQGLSCESGLQQLFSVAYEKLSHHMDPSHLANETPPWDLPTRLISTMPTSAAREGRTLPLVKANVYLYCAPCICQVWTAFRICKGADEYANCLFKFCVRVDDRLPATCCQLSSPIAGLAAIVEEIRSTEMDGKTTHPFNEGQNIQYIDRDWIDRRIYDQEDEMLQTSTVGEAKSLAFIFDQPLDTHMAATIILGERDHLVPMLQHRPFQHSEKIPRENQFFHIDRRLVDRDWVWSLKYDGIFTAKKPRPAQRATSSSGSLRVWQSRSEASIKDADLSSTSDQASSPTNVPAKRRRTEASLDD